MRQVMLRKKPLAHMIPEESGLKRVLGPWSLTALGIGCTIGAGIFVMPGEIAANYAGPAMIISFLIAALASALAALSYCELAGMMPVSGSAYSYTYATMGEFLAWLIGWNLLLEYGLANAAVAAGWGGYLNRLLNAFGLSIPPQLLYAPGQAIPGTSLVGILNLPAAVSILLVTVLLIIGIRESARTNAVLVALKIAVLVLFVAVGAWHFHPEYMHPFMLPGKGWGGVVSGAAVVFFLFIGFDAVSTVAEETKNPQRDLPLSILMGLGIVTLLYVSVATVLLGSLPLAQLHVAEPLAIALQAMNQPVAGFILSMVAVVGIASVLLVGSIGQTRILFVMSRDGLMPKFMSRVHPRFGTPVETTLLLGAVTALLAATIPLDALADLVSIGTLAAFIVVAVGVIVLRKAEPDRPRAFRCPWVPALPIAGIAINLYLMSGLSAAVWIRFAVWLALGLAIYFGWGHRSASEVFALREAKQRDANVVPMT